MIDPAPDEPANTAGLSGGILTAVFVAVVAVGVLLSGVGRAPDRAEVGSRAPALTITTFDGKTFDLADHIEGGGGPVLVNLWASWCEPCRREFPSLSAFADAHPGVTVLGVAVRDQHDLALAFVEEMEPSFLVAFDGDDTINEAYPVFSLPGTFVIDHRGIVVDIVLGELTPVRLDEIALDL